MIIKKQFNDCPDKTDSLNLIDIVMEDPRIERINNAAAYVSEKLGGRKPAVGIVLGSGLGKLAEK